MTPANSPRPSPRSAPRSRPFPRRRPAGAARARRAAGRPAAGGWPCPGGSSRSFSAWGSRRWWSPLWPGRRAGPAPPRKSPSGRPPRPSSPEEVAMDRADVYRATLRYFLAPAADLLYDDESVSEVVINGPDQIYCERSGRLEKVDRSFADEHVLTAAVVNLAEYVGRRLDDQHHSLDARLPEPEKFRVHAIIPPCSRQGVCVSIR